MKKLLLFLSLFGFMLAGCSRNTLFEKPNYIQFAEEQVDNENPLYEYYYSITETNDKNIVIITIYKGSIIKNSKYSVYDIEHIYVYNIEEGKSYALR